MTLRTWQSRVRGGVAALVLGLALAGLPQAVEAQQHHGGGGGRGGDGWHHDFGRDGGYDIGRWHGGHWWQGDHWGHHGWWWVVGPDWWYWYPGPVYPYPDFYMPPENVIPAPTGVYWYYCQNPAGYYPYVGRCLVPWQPLPPQPVPPPAP